MKTITLARKPTNGTVAANVIEHGSGGLNIDASRIGVSKSVPSSASRTSSGSSVQGFSDGSLRNETGNEDGHNPNIGRFPANLILQHLDGCVQDGLKRVKPPNGSGRTGAGSHGWHTSYVGGEAKAKGFNDSFSVDDEGKETVANWVCEDDCPVTALDEQSGVTKGTVRQPTGKAIYATEGSSVNWNSNSVKDISVRGFEDTGGASRFFKQVGEDK